MAVNWNLLGNAPDPGQAFQAGLEHGRQQLRQTRQDNALSALGKNPDDPQAQNALIALDPVRGVQAIQAIQQTQEMRRQEAIRQGEASAYDTTTGQIDPAKLRQAHAANGDVAGAMQLDTQQQQQQLAQIEFAHKVNDYGLHLLGSVHDQASWDQARQEYVATLQRFHLPAPELPDVYTPEAIHGLQMRALSTKEQLDAQKPVAVAEGTQLRNPQSGAIIAENPKPQEYQSVVMPNGDAYNFDKRTGTWTRAVEGSPAGGGAPGGASSTGHGAVALDGNNPGGINDSPFARSQPGYKGANGRFAAFATLEDGINAQTALLRSYVGRGYDTPAKIAARWAPAGDGNNPTSYAANVARAMGIGVNDKITPDKIAAFQHAQAMQENSTYGQRAGQGAATAAGHPINGAKPPDPVISDEGALLAAAIYRTKGSFPTGVGRTKGDVDKIMAFAAHMPMDHAHHIADETVGTWQTTRAQQETLTAFSKGKQADQVRSLNVAIHHIDQVRSAALALQNGNIPLFNAVAQQIAQSTGHAAPTNFDSVKQFVFDEVTKAIIGAGGGVNDREAAGRIIGRSASPAQLLGALEKVQGLMAGQARGLQTQYHAGTGRDDFADKYLEPRTRELLLGQQGGGHQITPTIRRIK